MEGINLRICKQCQEVMLEGFDIKVEGAGYGIKISKRTGVFSKKIEKPKVAICPKCGEVSLYIENIDEINK
jgi:RNase P subunit RPR2